MIRAGVRAVHFDSHPEVLWTKTKCASCKALIWVPGPTPLETDKPWCAEHGGVGGDGRLLMAIVR